MNINDIKSDEFIPTLEPGVHEVEIIGIEARNKEKADENTDYCVKMTNLIGNKQFEFHNYVTDNAMPYLLKKAKALVMASCNADEQASIKGETPEELLVAMLTAVQGKSLRIKFNGEEYIDPKDSSLKIKTTIGLIGIAESLEIPAEQTALKYNPESKWDLKRLPETLKENVAGYENPNTKKALNELSV